MFVSLHLYPEKKPFFRLSEVKELVGGSPYRVLTIARDWGEEIDIYLSSEQARELAETILQALEEAEGVA